MRPFFSLIHSGNEKSLVQLACVAAASGLLFPLGAMAQSTAPDRVKDRLPSSIAVPTAPAVEAPSVGSLNKSFSYKQSFTFKGIDFQGVTVYPESELKAAAEKFVGQKVTLSEVDAVVQDVLKRYRTDGYILVVGELQDKAPKDGVVTARFVEGYIANVVVDGVVKANARGQALITDITKKITMDRPLKASTLERYLLLLDDLPGVTAKGVVRRGDGAGQAELLVVMDHKTYDGSLEINNRGTRFVGREQAQATFAANSLFGIYDRTLIRGIMATPARELGFFDIQHEEQIGSEGTKLKLFASRARVEPGDTLKAADIEGVSTSYDIQIESPIIRSRKENFTPRAKLSYIDSEVTLLDVRNTEDKLRVVRAGANYDISDKWDGVNVFDAEISHGLDIFGATDKGVGRSRIDGENDFTKVTFDALRLQPLPKNFSILAGFSGQYALDPLLSSEEFSLGGANFGRAYDPSELSGDHGATAKIELRWANQPAKQWLNDYQLYTYYDIGAIWQKDAPVGVVEKQSLASAGLGVRSNFNSHLSGSAEISKPLTKVVSAEADDDTRLFFSLIGRF